MFAGEASKADYGASMFAGETPNGGYLATMFAGETPKADNEKERLFAVGNYYVGAPKREFVLRVCYGCSLFTGPYFSTLIA